MEVFTMAYYLVKAKPLEDLLPALKKRMDEGEIATMEPFGQVLHDGIENARLDENGFALWEEEDKCDPPLKEERQALLEQFFTDISATEVNKGEGWKKIENLPLLWDTYKKPEIDV
jgi:hypothetical protein